MDKSEAYDDLCQEALFLERNAVVVRAGHPILSASPIESTAIQDYPWIVLSEAAHTEDQLHQMLYENQQRTKKSVIRSDSPLFVKTMFLGADVIGITRHDAVRFELAKGIVVELTLGMSSDVLWKTHTIGVMYRRDTVLSAASEALIQAIKAECALAAYLPQVQR